MERKTCCVTGHRPKGFPWNYENDPANTYDHVFETTLERIIEKLINDGYNYFICGGAIGVDQAFATAVEYLRDLKYPHIQIEIAVPYPNQDKLWNKADKASYQEICTLADEVTLVSETYTKFCFHKRNEYMVDKSDLVLVVWNGEEKGGTYSTYQYAKRKKKPIELLLLADVLEEARKREEEMDAVDEQVFGKPLREFSKFPMDEFLKYCKKNKIKIPKKGKAEPSDAVVKAIADIELIEERRKKYYKK